MVKCKMFKQYTQRTVRLLLLSACFSCTTVESNEDQALDTAIKAANGEISMSQLTHAITQRDARAADIAVQLGKGAIAELSELMQSENSTTRLMSVRALGAMDLSLSYELLFKALDDEDRNVMHGALHEIEKQSQTLSTPIQLALLEKVTEPNATNRIILMLGKRLKPDEIGPLDKYCSNQHPQMVALHCLAALAKIGVELRRKQFAEYLLSINDNPKAFLDMFELIEYINQPWIAPSLRLLLTNKQEVLFLGDGAQEMGFPSFMRVCDKALQLVVKLIDIELEFNTSLAANYSDEQLQQVDFAIRKYNF